MAVCNGGAYSGRLGRKGPRFNLYRGLEGVHLMLGAGKRWRYFKAGNVWESLELIERSA